jgi:Na+-transporting NADH:ubiquinone oxidoreductase subunit C
VDKPTYIITFILIMTTLVAVLLTGLREVTMEKAALNEDIFNKRAILSAIESHLPDNKTVKDLSDEDVVSIFENDMEQLVVDAEGQVVEGAKAEDIDMAKERKKPVEEQRYPLFIYDAGPDQTFYIVAVRGNGLWDEIWGNIALESDLNTITGAAFDHKAETPGLGAEIKDNPNFSKQFKGKKIFSESGEYVSVTVKKGGADDSDPHQVDGISGATVTGDGVSDMMYKGIQNYLPYLKKVDNPANELQGMLIQ